MLVALPCLGVETSEEGRLLDSLILGAKGLSKGAGDKGWRITISYFPKYTAIGEKIYMVDRGLKSWPVELPVAAVHAKIVTDGFRFRSDIIPNQDGQIKYPPGAVRSPYLIFDGNRFVFSDNGGVRITDDRPIAGFPLPMEMITQMAFEASPAQCPNWSIFSKGLNWVDMISTSRDKASLAISQKSTATTVIETNLGNGYSGPFFHAEFDNKWPLWPSVLISGYTHKGLAEKTCEVEFREYQNFGNIILPKEIVAILKLNMESSCYNIPSLIEQKTRLISMGVPMNGTYKLFEHRLIIENVENVDVKSSFDAPLEPGVEVRNDITGEHFIWGDKLEKLSRQLR